MGNGGPHSAVAGGARVPDQEADEHVVSDPELITRVRTGDREAFGELYRRHSGPATALSRQFARSAAESDDLVSESFARVLDNLLAGKGPDTAFRAYLFTTIRNTAYDRTRKDKRLQFTDDMTAHDVAVVGDDPVLAKMESGLVATAFAQLPERWQAVLWHTQVEGETPAQVGALLGMAPGAVSSLAFRAREGLREAYLQAHLAETAGEKCRATADRLGAWTRGGLSKREKAQVDAHLAECERCTALAAELNEVNQGLRGLLAPLLLGTAAAGYVATLGPVAPLAAPGTLIAGVTGGAASSGAATGGTTGTAGTAGAGTAGTAGAGTTAGATGSAAAGTAGASGSAAAGTAAAGAAAGAGTGAAGTAAAAGVAGVAAVGATTVGATANASTSTTGSAGSTAAGSTTAGSTAGTTAVGSTAAGSSGAAGTAAAAGAAGAAGAGVGAAGAATGLAGVLAGIGVGGLVAAGAALVVAAVVAVALVVSGASSDTDTTAADSQTSISAVTEATEVTEVTEDHTDGEQQTDPLSSLGTVATDPSTAESPLAGTTEASATDTTAATATTDVTDEFAAVVTAETTITAGILGNGPADNASESEADPVTASQTDSVAELPSEDTSPSPPADLPTEIQTTLPTSTAAAPPLPADLTVSDLLSSSLTAGGIGTLSLVITNSGDQASPAEPMTIVVPGGVSVVSVGVAPVGSPLRRAALAEPNPCTPTGDRSPTGELTCSTDFPGVPGHSAVTVTVNLQADIAAMGGGNIRILINEQSLGSTAVTVLPAPAALSLSALTVSQPLIAGGTGELQLTVTNSGGQNSAAGQITVDLPDGINRGDIRGGAVTCADGVCTLQPVAPGALNAATLTIPVTVEPTVPASPGGVTATVGDLTTDPLPLTVASGITALSADPGQLTAGIPTLVTITADLTVTDPGPVTVTSGSASLIFGPTPACTPLTGGSAVTCTFSDGAVTLPVLVDDKTTSESVPISVTDAGGRTLQLAPLQVSPAPASLSLSELTVSQALNAGGTGQLAVTVSNSGGQAAIGQEIAAELPNGVLLTGITAGQAQLCAGAIELVCTLPSIGVDTTVPLLIDLSIAPGTPAVTFPPAVVAVPGDAVFRSLTIDSGIASLTANPAQVVAGGNTPVSIAAPLKDGVTDPGSVTFASTAADLLFEGTTSCTPTGGGVTVTCTVTDGAIALSVDIPANTFTGPVPITVTDAGGRDISDLLAPIQVIAAPAALSVSDLTVGEPLIAGGTGALSLTVGNPGGQATAPLPITVELPSGIGYGPITPGTTVTCDESTCTLLPVPAGSTEVSVTIPVIVPPTVVQSPLFPAVVTIDGQPRELFLDVATPFAAVTASPTEVTAGASTPVTITAAVKDGVTDPGTLTFTSGADELAFGATPDCTPSADGDAVTCAISGGPVTLDLVVQDSTFSGEVPVTVTDAGSRQPVADLTFDVIAVPATLTLSDLTVSRPLVAGGTGELALTVTNGGGLNSTPQEITVVLPDGITHGDIAGDDVTCTAGTCTLGPVAPGEQNAVTLTIPLSVAATVTGDTVQASVRIADETASADLNVTSGITSISVSPGQLTAGGATPVTLSAALDPTVTDPGQVTVTSGASVLVFGSSPSCIPTGGGSTATCTLTNGAVTLPAVVADNTVSGSVSITVTDAGARTVAELPIQVIPAGASLALSDLTVTAPLAAGGTGALSLTVTNTGGQNSTPQLITVSLPTGIDNGVITGTGVTCTNGACSVGPVAPGDGNATIITIPLTVQPVVGADPGTATVTINGVTTEPLPLQVAAGITSLTANPGQVTAGGSTGIAISAAVRDDVTDAGPVTFASTDPQLVFAGSDACTAAGGGSTVTCVIEGGVVPLTVTVADDTFAGSVPITVTDAGGRSLALPPIQVSAAPAALSLSELTVTEPLVAGGTGALSMTVTNSGGLASAPQLITIALPGGITRDEISPGDAVTCTNGVCTLQPVAAGEANAVTLTIPLVVPATVIGSPGTAFVSIGDLDTEPVPLAVEPGITALTAAPGEITAGADTPLTITAQLAPTVTDPGPVTLTSGSADLVFGASTACTPGAGGASVRCTLSAGTIDLSVVVADNTVSGPVPIAVTDAGGRTLILAPIQVDAATAEVALSELAVTRAPIAGGTGAVSLTVTNTGGRTSAAQDISVTVPDGVDAGAITPDSAVTCNDVGCTLRPLAPGAGATLTIPLTLDPTVGAAPPLPVVVTIDGRSKQVLLAVDSPISTLTASPDQVTAGGTTPVTLTATIKDGVLDPGTVTLTSGSAELEFGASTSCTPATGGGSATCTISTGTFTLPVVIADNTVTGEVPITVTDAGGRTITLAPIQVVAGAADLTLSDLTVSAPLVAGGTGALQLTVSNTGGQNSTPQVITVALPDGIDRGDIAGTGISCIDGVCTLPVDRPGRGQRAHPDNPADRR